MVSCTHTNGVGATARRNLRHIRNSAGPVACRSASCGSLQSLSLGTCRSAALTSCHRLLGEAGADEEPTLIEKTVILTIDMDGDEAVWMGDANAVLMPSHLDEEGRRAALCNLSAKWQRTFIRLVPSAA